MDRIELLNNIFASRTRLEAMLAKLTPEQMTENRLPGGWSVKDLLAHLGWWEGRANAVYAAISKGERPREVIHAEDVDRVNARTLAESRAIGLDVVRSAEQEEFRKLVTLVESIPEEELVDPQHFAYLEGQPFSHMVVINTYGHYDEHFAALEEMLAEQAGALRPQAQAASVAAQGGQPVPKSPGEEMNPAIRKAGEFLQREGRDIEQAMFDHFFGSLPLERVMEALARYQNPDGGFFGLEVDIKAPQSNPFATELALNAMRWLDVPRDHPVLQRAVEYLEVTQEEDGTWRFAPEIYQHGLAPWFQHWKWPNLNPSCTIAGLLKQLGVGSDPLHTRVQALFDRLANPSDLTGKEYYNIRPYAYYLQSEWDFPKAEFYRYGVAWWMVRQHLGESELDATHFFDFATTPQSAITRRLPGEVLKARLDQLLAEQQEDGGWPTPYDPHWRGWNTILNLVILRAYGHI